MWLLDFKSAPSGIEHMQDNIEQIYFETNILDRYSLGLVLCFETRGNLEWDFPTV